MHIQVNNPRPDDSLVEQVGPVLAHHLTAKAVKNEVPQLALAQSFQERVVARQNARGMRGKDGIGQCVARMDAGLFLRIFKKHAAEIKADSRKFWLVTAPSKYPELGLKPKYIARAGIFSPGKLLKTA